MCVCIRVGLRVRACRGRFLGLGFLRAGSASVVAPRTERSCPVRSRASFMIVFAFHGYVFICLLSLSLSSLIMSSLHHLVTLVRSDDEIGFIAPFGLPLDGVVCIHSDQGQECLQHAGELQIRAMQRRRRRRPWLRPSGSRGGGGGCGCGCGGGRPRRRPRRRRWRSRRWPGGSCGGHGRGGHGFFGFCGGGGDLGGGGGDGGD